MAAHKPLPSLPKPEGLFRSTTLSAQAKLHRRRLLQHFFANDIDQPEPAFTARQRDGWIGVIEHALDDLSDLVVQQEWLTSVRKGRVVKERHSKALATSSAPTTKDTPDKPLPELDPLFVIRNLATRPKPTTKKPRPGHLVLCLAPHRGGDIPLEDSGFDIVPANLVCLFKPGRYHVEEGAVLYGLEGISNNILDTPISLVGGSFVLKGATTLRQHQRLRPLLHIAIYIHLSLILEQHLLVNSSAEIQYALPPSDAVLPNDAPPDNKPSNVDSQKDTTKEDYTLFAWSSNLRKRATMIPSSFSLGHFNFFARRNSVSTPIPQRPRDGGSLDLPLYNWTPGNKDATTRKSIEEAKPKDVPTTTAAHPTPTPPAADPGSTDDPPLTSIDTSTPLPPLPPPSSTSSTPQPAQSQPQLQQPPLQPQPVVQPPQPEVQAPPSEPQPQSHPPVSISNSAQPHPPRLHRLSFRLAGAGRGEGGSSGERRPLASALRRRPTVAGTGTRPEANHSLSIRPLSAWFPSASPSSSQPPLPPPNGVSDAHGSTATSTANANTNATHGPGMTNGRDVVAYDAWTGPPPSLPFATALARLEETKDLYSTSPNLDIPPPKLLLDLAEKERSYHQYERNARNSSNAMATARRQEQRSVQVALGRLGGGGYGKPGQGGHQWPWWLKGDDKVALSTLMICSFGAEDEAVGVGSSSQPQAQPGSHRHGAGLRALLGLDQDPMSPSGGAGPTEGKRRRPLHDFAMHQNLSVLWSVHVPNTGSSSLKSGSTKGKDKDKELEKDKDKEVNPPEDPDSTSSRLTTSSTTTTDSSATSNTASTSNTNANTITGKSTLRDVDAAGLSSSSSSSIQSETTACGKPYWRTYQFYSNLSSSSSSSPSPSATDSSDASLGSVLSSWINERYRACELRPGLCPFERGMHERRLIHGGVLVSVRIGDGNPDETEEVLQKAEVTETKEVDNQDVTEGGKVVIVPSDAPVVEDEPEEKIADEPKDVELAKEAPSGPEEKTGSATDETPIEEEEILVVRMEMYLSCSVCGARTKRTQMDDGTCLLSFAKFIELLVYSPALYNISPTLCEHTTPPSQPIPAAGASSHPPRFQHITPNLLRHFYLPSHSTDPLIPTGEVIISARPIEDSIFEICLPRMQLLSGLGVDSTGRLTQWGGAFGGGLGGLKNALTLSASGITRKARSFSARRLRRSESAAAAPDKGKEETGETGADEQEKGKGKDDSSLPMEGEQKRILRMEIKRWWEGVAAHVDKIESALEEQEKAQDALLSRNPSQARRVQKALPRLPSAHDAYDVFEGLDEGKTPEPSTSSATPISTSKFTTNSRTDSDAMSTLKESDAEDEGGKTPTPPVPAELPTENDTEDESQSGSGAQTPKADRLASEASTSKASEVIVPSSAPTEDAPPALPTESTVSLAPTLPPKDDIPRRTASLPGPSIDAPLAPEAVKADPPERPATEPPAVLLSTLRHHFHQLEHGLYAQLAKTPESRLNDVRRSFLSVARGSEKRLRAWEQKHLRPATGKKPEGGSGGLKREGLSRRNTNESVSPLTAPEPEWWSKGCHVLPGGDVIVREGDWGSIIAHTLSASDYQTELANMTAGRLVSISSTSSSGPTSTGTNHPSSLPTTPRGDHGSTSSYPSSFFSLPGRYRLFSSPAAQPDPDNDNSEWHEQESYFAIVSRKQHHREATPTPTSNTSTGGTATSNVSLREAIISRIPKKEIADGQEGIITTATRVAISAVSAPATIVNSKPADSPVASPQQNVKARPDVQISKEAATGEINSTTSDTENVLLKEISGATPSESATSGTHVLEQVDSSLKRTNAGSVSRASEKVLGKMKAEEQDKPDSQPSIPKDDAVSVTGPPPLPPPKDDTHEAQEPPVPPPKPAQKLANELPALPAEPTSNPPPTSSGFAAALASGLQHVAMRLMLHSEPSSRNASPSQPPVKHHHELLASQPLPVAPPSLFAIDDRPHIKYDWTIGKRLKFSCTTYYAKQFDLLRKRCGIDDIYVKSLSRSTNWVAEGGKSRSNFWKTADDRFIIKTLVNAWNVADLQVLIELAPSYFRYMEATANKATVLAKLAGFYTIEIRNLETGAVQAKADLLVMENLFYNRHINKTFDLKGIQGRKVKTKFPTTKTLFDGEWIEGQQRSLTLVQPYSKVTMKEAIQTDAEFLSKSNIMDYSLLMGFDQDKRQIACGLVDTIGSFTFAKTLEYKAKHNLQTGTKEVTVMPPNEYQERFVKSLDDYIVACPGT